MSDRFSMPPSGYNLPPGVTARDCEGRDGEACATCDELFDPGDLDAFTGECPDCKKSRIEYENHMGS